jgi:hypothetical protein
MVNNYTLNERKNNNVFCFLTDEEEYQEERYEIYSMIIKTLVCKHNKGYLKELNKRLSSNENINDVLIDFIDREEDNVDTFIWLLKERLHEYSENDLFSKFLL